MLRAGYAAGCLTVAVLLLTGGACSVAEDVKDSPVTTVDILDSDQPPGWLRWSFQRSYVARTPEDADPLTWVRRHTPRSGTVTGWLRLDSKGIAELVSATVDSDGVTWMQSRLVRDGASTMRDFTRCRQTSLEVDLPPSLADLVAEDLGSVRPPNHADHEGTHLRWTEPQGVIVLHITQDGPAPVDRDVQAVGAGDGRPVFETINFALERVAGPPVGLWVTEEEFTRTCQPLADTDTSSRADLTG